MTREEAIKILHDCKACTNYCIDEYYEAIEVAIEALQTEPCEDAISRMQAKSFAAGSGLIKRIDGEDWINVSEVRENLDMLPSVNPQNGINNNAVNLCDSCKYDYPECPSGKKDILFGDGKGNDNVCCCNKYLPSVKPAQKVGKWKRVSIDKYVQHASAFYRCSECGKDHIGMTNFCSNCGAKMEEGE